MADEQVLYEGIPLDWDSGDVEDLKDPEDIPAEDVEVDNAD